MQIAVRIQSNSVLSSWRPHQPTVTTTCSLLYVLRRWPFFGIRSDSLKCSFSSTFCRLISDDAPNQSVWKPCYRRTRLTPPLASSYLVRISDQPPKSFVVLFISSVEIFYMYWGHRRYCSCPSEYLLLKFYVMTIPPVIGCNVASFLRGGANNE